MAANSPNSLGPSVRTLGIASFLIVVPIVVFGHRGRDEIDISTGRKRDSFSICGIAIWWQVRETALSRALRPADIEGTRPQWHLVNSAPFYKRYSPHFAFHGAYIHIWTLEMFWEGGNFTPEARRASAKHVLELWQAEDSSYSASEYLNELSELSADNLESGEPTTAEEVEALHGK